MAMIKRLALRLFWLPLAVVLMAGVAAAANSAASDAKTAAFFEKAFGEYLSSSLPDTVSDFRIIDISTSGNERIPATFDEHRFTVIRTSKGMETVIGEAVFYANGNEIKKLSASAKVELEAEVVVASERVARGSTIADGMVRLEKMKVRGPVGELCTDLAEVVGQVADRSLQPNRPVAKASLAQPMDVKAGDLILILAESSVVKLTTRGIAKKDGSIGDLIPVVNLRSNKRLFGRVVDAGTVQVAF